MAYYFKYLKRGVYYAAIFLLVAGIMGVVYGLFGGVVVGPFFFGITMLSIFVLLNFIVAFIIGVFNMLFAIFKAQSNQLVRYFALSTGFMAVVLLFFAAFKLVSPQVF